MRGPTWRGPRRQGLFLLGSGPPYGVRSAYRSYGRRISCDHNRQLPRIPGMPKTEFGEGPRGDSSCRWMTASHRVSLGASPGIGFPGGTGDSTIPDTTVLNAPWSRMA